jgi:dUTP pyrophosphatase
VIEENYYEGVKVLLFNFGDNEFDVKIGDRIAQLLLEKILHAEIKEIDEDSLTNTARGVDGFGLTGV